MENIKKEIKHMVLIDQKTKFKESKLIDKIDSKNRKRVKEIFEKYGYITVNTWGKETSHNFWLLLQHFPKTEINFIEKYLLYMESHQSQFLLEDIAYLRDKVNTYKNVPQIYGTQFFEDVNLNALKFEPIQDIKQVDLNRKSVGLESLVEYAEASAKLLDMKFILPEEYSKNFN